MNKIVMINFRLFHLGQSVYHQVQQLGPTQEYYTSVQFKQRIKMLTCLAIQPKEYGVLGFESLSTTAGLFRRKLYWKRKAGETGNPWTSDRDMELIFRENQGRTISWRDGTSAFRSL